MMQDTLNDTIYPSDLMQRNPDIEPVGHNPIINQWVGERGA